MQGVKGQPAAHVKATQNANVLQAQRIFLRHRKHVARGGTRSLENYARRWVGKCALAWRKTVVNHNAGWPCC